MTPVEATPALPTKTAVSTLLAMLAFAGNSLLCRAALRQGSIDASSFTAIRLLSGAVVLGVVFALRGGGWRVGTWRAGSWSAGVALFAYAAGFSLAYRGLGAATGALLLFGAVQMTMMVHGLWRGERLQRAQVAGWMLAVVGFVVLLVPGITAPPAGPGALMLGAGFAWGVYSLRGKAVDDPLRATAGNFARATPMALALIVVDSRHSHIQQAGVLYAVASGGLASGLGYAVWYAALRALRSTIAATVQLSVPMIAAVGGVVFLSEPVTPRLIVAGFVLLGGIALVAWRGRSPA
jgi:drug/metabolite transporter (DMT)-like permease